MLIGLLFSFLGPSCAAAPIPATSSSLIVSQRRGLFRSPAGFEISAENTDWSLTQPARPTPFVLTEYRSPDWSNGVQGALTVRLDVETRAKNLRGYVKHWLKDYSRFGLTVTQSKTIKLRGQNAHMIDMVNPTNQRQLRQYLLHRGTQTIILTCRAHQKNFDRTVRECNQIARNFRWSGSESDIKSPSLLR
jgi:hypothetical protein